MNKLYTKIYNTPNDTYFILNIGPEKLKVGELGFHMWEHNIIIPLKDRILKLLFDEIDKARHNLTMATSLNILASIIDSFIATQEFSTEPLKVFQFIYANTI